MHGAVRVSVLCSVSVLAEVIRCAGPVCPRWSAGVGVALQWRVFMVLPPGAQGVSEDREMTSRRRVTVWSGAGLAVVGGAVALVVWVGLGKANAELGAPAAIAALLGLGLAVFPPKSEGTDKHESGHSLDQRGKAIKGGQVLQVGADSATGLGSGRTTTTKPVTGSRKQHATAKGQGSRVEQVGGDRVDGGCDAGQA